MSKVPHACKYHGNAVFIALFDRVLIADRTSRLDNRRNTRLVRALYAVVKREKCIRSEYGSLCRMLPDQLCGMLGSLLAAQTRFT